MLLFAQRLAKQAPGFGLKTAVDDFRASEARVTIMVLDACRDNPLTPPGAVRSEARRACDLPRHRTDY
jgi:hypothetical protein